MPGFLNLDIKNTGDPSSGNLETSAELQLNTQFSNYNFEVAPSSITASSNIIINNHSIGFSLSNSLSSPIEPNISFNYGVPQQVNSQLTYSYGIRIIPTALVIVSYYIKQPVTRLIPAY